MGICCPSQPLDFLAGGGLALLDLVSGLVVGGGGIEWEEVVLRGLVGGSSCF